MRRAHLAKADELLRQLRSAVTALQPDAAVLDHLAAVSDWLGGFRKA